MAWVAGKWSALQETMLSRKGTRSNHRDDPTLTRPDDSRSSHGHPLGSSGIGGGGGIGGSESGDSAPASPTQLPSFRFVPRRSSIVSSYVSDGALNELLNRTEWDGECPAVLPNVRGGAGARLHRTPPNKQARPPSDNRGRQARAGDSLISAADGEASAWAQCACRVERRVDRLQNSLDRRLFDLERLVRDSSGNQTGQTPPHKLATSSSEINDEPTSTEDLHSTAETIKTDRSVTGPSSGPRHHRGGSSAPAPLPRQSSERHVVFEGFSVETSSLTPLAPTLEAPPMSVSENFFSTSPHARPAHHWRLPGDGGCFEAVAAEPPPARPMDIPVYLQEEEVSPRVFLPDCVFREAWDVLYLVLCLLEVVLYTTPLFTISSGEFTITLPTWALVLKAFMTLFWFADLFVQANTLVIADGAGAIDDPAVLRARYIRTYFIFDLLATVPLDLLTRPASVAVAQHSSVLRVLRVYRVPHLFRRSTPSRTIPWGTEILICCFWSAVYTQVSSGLWLAMATEEEQMLAAPIAEAPWEAYLNAVYFIVTVLSSVGFGDVSPKRTPTKIYITFQNIVGAVFLVIAGGRSGAYFITTDPLELLTIERKRGIESLMERHNVPWSTQRDAFAVYPAVLAASSRDYKHILDLLPENVQERVQFHIKKTLMRKVPMFKELTNDTIALLAWKLCDQYLPPQRYVIRAGEDGAAMFFLANGVVEVLLPDRGGEEVWAANLTGGSWFGEIALLKQTKRIASVRTLTHCACYRLDKTGFEAVVGVSDELRAVMEAETLRRVEMIRTRKSMGTAINKVVSSRRRLSTVDPTRIRVNSATIRTSDDGVDGRRGTGFSATDHSSGTSDPTSPAVNSDNEVSPFHNCDSSNTSS